MVVKIADCGPEHGTLPELMGIGTYLTRELNQIKPITAFTILRFQRRHRRNIGDSPQLFWLTVLFPIETFGKKNSPLSVI